VVRDVRRRRGNVDKVTGFTPQSRAAWERAQHTRHARSQLRLRVTQARPSDAGARELAAVLEERPECIGRMYVETILAWPHYATRQRVMRLMRRAGVGATKTVGQLTDRQIGVLVLELRAMADTSRGRDAA
jgi:hypothetical protein